MADKDQLISALSDLVGNYVEIHSNGEGCPACGGDVVEVEISTGDTDTAFQHDAPCPLAIAMKLLRE